MNKAETALVNSPPRRRLQRFYETGVLLRFGGRLLPGARALEIGCGSGCGSQLVLERFGAASVDAEQFLDELTHHGLVVLGSTTRTSGDYLLGVAAKPVPTRSGGLLALATLLVVAAAAIGTTRRAPQTRSDQD